MRHHLLGWVWEHIVRHRLPLEHGEREWWEEVLWLSLIHHEISIFFASTIRQLALIIVKGWAALYLGLIRVIHCGWSADIHQLIWFRRLSLGRYVFVKLSGLRGTELILRNLCSFRVLTWELVVSSHLWNSWLALMVKLIEWSRLLSPVNLRLNALGALTVVHEWHGLGLSLMSLSLSVVVSLCWFNLLWVTGGHHSLLLAVMRFLIRCWKIVYRVE